MGSEAYHESIDRLSPQTIELHRAIESLREELEAIDWYQQRVDATADLELQKVLRHNRNEEIEHAAMVLEWIRRRDRDFDQALRHYLFTEGDITEIETVVEGTGQKPEP
jgi:ferritin-like protein